MDAGALRKVVNPRAPHRVQWAMSASGSSFWRWTALALLLVGGAAFSEETKTGWTEVKTAHVTLRTNLSPEAARRGALLAEKSRAALLAAAWPEAKLTEDRIELIVLSSRQDFESYFGSLVSGEFVHMGYPPSVFLFGTPERWEDRRTREREVTWFQTHALAPYAPSTRSVLRHEMVHHLMSFFYRREPRWFAEGFAQFLETARFSEDGKSVTLGDINLDAVREYTSFRTFTVADALAWGTTFEPKDDGSIRGLYGMSWMMVLWLYDTRPADFVRFQKLLATGLDPSKAWKVVFPTLTPGEVDREIFHFSRYGHYGVTTVTIPETQAADVHLRPMTSAEMHATLATIALAAKQTKTALAEVGEALVDEPGNVAALRLQTELVQPRERLVLGQLAVKTHPEDGLAWLTLADALREGGGSWDETERAYRKAIELRPDHPAAYNVLAWMVLRDGHAAEALQLASAAVRMAPWDANILDTLASVQAALGKCSEAISTQARALDMASENVQARRPEFAARLRDRQKVCEEVWASMPAHAAEAPASPHEP
jgi:hypothetical protein